MKYNENLLGLRKKANYTQQQIADILNISQRAYAHYEKGESEPCVEALLKLSDLYNVSIDAICGKYDIPGIKKMIEPPKTKRGRKPKPKEQPQNEDTK